MVFPDVEATMDASVEADALRNQLLSEGIVMTDLKASTNNADVWVPIYHAFDGRMVKVPFYMVDTKEGASLLQRIFTAQDIKSSNADPRWVGKRVWYTKPQPTPSSGGTLRCPFSVHGSEEDQAAIQARGFRVDCRKDVVFVTLDERDKHVEKRHPRRTEALRRLEEREFREEQMRQSANNAATIAALVERLTATTKEK